MNVRILLSGVMGIGKSYLTSALADLYFLPILSGSSKYIPLSDNYRELVMTVDISKKQDSIPSYVSDRSIIDFMIGNALQNKVTFDEFSQSVRAMYESNIKLFNTDENTKTILVIAPYVDPRITIQPGHKKRPILDQIIERGYDGFRSYNYSYFLANLLEELDPLLTVIYNNFHFSGDEHELDKFRKKWQEYSKQEVIRILTDAGVEKKQFYDGDAV